MRVRVHWLGVTLGLVLLACVGRFPAPPPAAPEVVRADLHIHVSMAQAAKPLVKGESGDGKLAGSGSTILVNQVDGDQLQASGVRLLYATVWPPFNLRPGRTALDEALDQLQKLRDFASRRPGFREVLTAAQARAALQAGKVALIPQVEGGEGIEKVEDVDALYAAGMRSLTLVHFTGNALAGAAKGQGVPALMGLHLEGLEPQGLTPLGVQVVQRLFDLGVVVDLAHASDATYRDVLALAEARGVPVIVSHTGTRTFEPIERDVTDELAARVVKGGGLIGVTLFTKQVGGEIPAEERASGDVPGTCDDVLAHWTHLAKAVGQGERVVLGSDFNGFIPRHGKGGHCPDGVRHAGDLPVLFDALKARGAPGLDSSGEALLQLVEQAEARSSLEARARAMRERRPAASLFEAGL